MEISTPAEWYSPAGCRALLLALLTARWLSECSKLVLLKQVVKLLSLWPMVYSRRYRRIASTTKNPAITAAVGMSPSVMRAAVPPATSPRPPILIFLILSLEVKTDDIPGGLPHQSHIICVGIQSGFGYLQIVGTYAGHLLYLSSVSADSRLLGQVVTGGDGLFLVRLSYCSDH